VKPADAFAGYRRTALVRIQFHQDASRPIHPTRDIVVSFDRDAAVHPLLCSTEPAVCGQSPILANIRPPCARARV